MEMNMKKSVYPLNGHEFEQTPGNSERQGSPACCAQSMGSHDWATEQQKLNHFAVQQRWSQRCKSLHFNKLLKNKTQGSEYLVLANTAVWSYLCNLGTDFPCSELSCTFKRTFGFEASISGSFSEATTLQKHQSEAPSQNTFTRWHHSLLVGCSIKTKDFYLV